MKMISSLILACFLISSSALVHASEYYTVESAKGIKAGIYHDGKLIVPSGPRNSISPFTITDVKRVKDTLFFTEVSGEIFDGQCNLYFPRYNLKAKMGKNKVTIFKDKIYENMSRIETDGKYLYYISAVNVKKGDLVRMTADGKSRQTIEKGIEDFWYQGNKLYFVKNQTIYSKDLKSQKKSPLTIGAKKLKSPSVCTYKHFNSNNYFLSENGIMYFKRETKKNNAVYEFYSYKSGRVTQHVLRSYSTMYTKKVDLLTSDVFDIDSATGDFIELNTDADSNTIVLRKPNGEITKPLLTPKETVFRDGLLINVKRVDIAKREIVFVKGTKIISKKF